MQTLSRRRIGSASALAMAFVAGLPALAEAQLIPNLFVRRERTPTAAEPPFYGHVRHEYYGYYPTCWKRFPDGWACPCPNPEAPNTAAAFQRQPRDPKPTIPPEDQELMGDKPDPTLPVVPGAGPRTPGGRAPAVDPFLIPPVPNERRSPFNIDGNPTDPGAAPAGSATKPGGAAPATADPLSPAPRTNPGASGLPSLDRPAGDASSDRGARPAPSDPDEPRSPLLALPEIASPSGSLPVDASSVAAMPPSLPTNGAYIDAPDTLGGMRPEPAQAPRRPSLIGSLFNQGSRRRR